MRKTIKVAFAAAVVAITGYGVYTNQKTDIMSDVMLANAEASASEKENPMCPNGCVDGGDGCTCNGITYPSWKEYDWKD